MISSSDGSRNTGALVAVLDEAINGLLSCCLPELCCCLFPPSLLRQGQPPMHRGVNSPGRRLLILHSGLWQVELWWQRCAASSAIDCKDRTLALLPAPTRHGQGFDVQGSDGDAAKSPWQQDSSDGSFRQCCRTSRWGTLIRLARVIPHHIGRRAFPFSCSSPFSLSLAPLFHCLREVFIKAYNYFWFLV